MSSIDAVCEEHSDVVDRLLNTVSKIQAELEEADKIREKAMLRLHNLHAHLYNAPRTERSREIRKENFKDLVTAVTTPGHPLNEALAGPHSPDDPFGHNAVTREAAKPYIYAFPGQLGLGYFYIETGLITMMSHDSETWITLDDVPGQLINLYDCVGKYIKVRVPGGWRLFEQTSEGVRVQNIPDKEEGEPS